MIYLTDFNQTHTYKQGYVYSYYCKVLDFLIKFFILKSITIVICESTKFRLQIRNCLTVSDERDLPSRVAVCHFSQMV